MKNVPELIQVFQTLPACDRLYLLCQMLHKCISYELVYVKNLLLGNIAEDIRSLAPLETSANKLDSFPTCSSLSLDNETLDTLICSFALVRHDNTIVADKMYSLLNDRHILLKAEELEDQEMLNKLRLLYVLVVYHPALSISKRHHLLDVFLRHLDELWESRRQAAEEEQREEDQFPPLEDRPSMPSQDAYIINCELKSVYKRQTDRRYPYIVEVEWSDGAYCLVHRTYGDFFTFQNKLLDIFPEESGQKSKKLRVIPFLPGRKLLSGRSNRELAEKRLPELWQYTHDLFTLPEHITRCKHVLDFLRPRPSDIKEEGFTYQKVTTLSDIKNKIRHSSAAVAFLTSSSPSSSPSRPHSSVMLSTGGGGVNGRVSHTLPAQQSPGQIKDKQATPIERRSTYPARPPQSAFTPVPPRSSNEKLHSNSQTSVASSNEFPGTPPTTVACHVVTPPCNRPNGSPAFSLSHLSNSGSSSPIISSSSGNIKIEQTSSPSIIKLVRASKLKRETKSLDMLSAPPTTEKSNIIPVTKDTVTTDTVTKDTSWADRSISPPKDDLSVSPFPVSSHSVTSTVVMTTASASLTTPPTVVTSSLAPPISHHSKSSVPFSPSLPQLYPYATPPHAHANYPCSYTPTRFDTPSPKPLMGAGPSGRYICATPTSEPEHFKKWLKCHRLHKYDTLFQSMSFDEVSKLTVDRMKELGMTQGAAKKLSQKFSELINNGITSFHDIPIPNISRRPSTTSLPAALLLERQQLTPSSSIDQLSLHGGSTCSLDVLGHHAYNTTPSHRHSDSLTDTMISNVDRAILETGPPTSLINGNKRESDIEPDGSHTPSKLVVINGQSRHSQPNMPYYWTPPPYTVTTPIDKPTPPDTSRTYPPTYRQEGPPLYIDQHRISPALVPNRIQGNVVPPNWPHPLSAPMLVRGMRGPVLAYTPINGLVRSPGVTSGGTPQRYPLIPPTSTSSHHRSPMSSCYKCGQRGHQGNNCPVIYMTDPHSGLMRS